MIFSSKLFLFIFLPFVLFVYYGFLRKTKEVKNIFLLFVSLFFYSWGEPVYIWLMIATIIANYIYGLLVNLVKGKGHKKFESYIVLTLMVLTNLGILGYFKYYQFVVLQINRFLHTDLSVPGVVLPIGISFFTFQAMSYVFDVYRGKGHVQKNPLKVGLYISFFPQLIAGPIVRYETIADQIDNRKENLEDFKKGVSRFIAGLIKKVIIANNLAHIADQGFDFINSSGFHGSVSLAWLAAIAYTLQIYFDFSGYSDMAIGLGQMFGFHFEENFNYPYIAHNITDFWRRWHISMQTWFKDYLYIPLGGNRVGKGRYYLNIFIVWLCTGIWHGANWTYLAWGMLNMVFLLVESFTGLNKKKTWWGHVYSLILIFISMVVFRSTGLGAAKNYIFAMFGIGANGLLDAPTLLFIKQFWPYLIMGVIGAMPVIPFMDKKYGDKAWWNVIYVAGTIMLLLVAMTFIFNEAYSPFIYFNF